MSSVMKPGDKPGGMDQAMGYLQMYQTAKGAFSPGEKKGAMERRKSQVMTPQKSGGGMPGVGG